MYYKKKMRKWVIGEDVCRNGILHFLCFTLYNFISADRENRNEFIWKNDSNYY